MASQTWGSHQRSTKTIDTQAPAGWCRHRVSRFWHGSQSQVDTLNIEVSPSTRVVSALPAYALENAVLVPTAVEQHDKKRQSQRRDGAIEEGKVGFGDTAVETEEVAHPQEDDQPPVVDPGHQMRSEMHVPQLDGQQWQREQKQNVEDAPEGQRQTVREEQRQVLGPALYHRRGRAVHARGDGVAGVAEA